ncbi:hypothetical protein EPUL_003290 [Erysiphe pulchra]|uniref:ATP-dependent DNA helicase n=1 Tax=Erysiphe pulchra TaxID=225359 RepID=A0A2S4PW17_9PEZI|nr:hypothetical protein EPUL_003290 [Erysiphe pulchra]
MARIPTEDPELATIIKSQLVHGPCGPAYPNAPCMRNGKCSKCYLKRWCETTVFAENSYPEYARPNDGVTWTNRNGNFAFDNRWVVPYNAFLTKKYSAHINVEIAHRATLALQERNDEISMKTKGRYISPVQSVWRLFSYATHEEKPAVMLLPYHLEGRHRVSFTTNLAAAIESQSSAFSDWMRYNAANTDGRDLCYPDFPLFYTHTKRNGWHKRAKGHAIGRMSVAVPRQGEHFYLRTLLTMKRSAKSYRDLYTVNGDTMAVPLQHVIRDTTPTTSLRQTFASELAFAVINDPQSLWDRDRLNPPPIEWDKNRCRYDYGLWLLGENLRDHNLSWIEAQIAGPLHDWTPREANPLLAEALNINFEVENSIHAEFLANLNPSQSIAYTTVINTVESGSIPNAFFVQGPAGTGKTFLYTTLCSYFRAKDEVVLCNTQGTESQYTTIASSYQNGLVERNIGTAEASMRTMLKEAELPIEFWDEAVSTDVYLRNRTNTGPITDGKITSPEGAWTGITPSIEHNKGLGKTIPVGQRHDKLVNTGRVGVFVGYTATTKQLRVYSPELGYTFRSSRVLIDERVKGGSIDLKLRKSTFESQGTVNMMPDRKPQGRPRKDASYSIKLLLPQQVEKESPEIINTAILPLSNIGSSQSPLPLSLSPPESYSIRDMNPSYPQPNYDLALFDNTPEVISSISSLPNSDSGHNPILSTSIIKIPEEISPKSESTKLTHSIAPSKIHLSKRQL